MGDSVESPGVNFDSVGCFGSFDGSAIAREGEKMGVWETERGQLHQRLFRRAAQLATCSLKSVFGDLILAERAFLALPRLSDPDPPLLDASWRRQP